MSAVGFLKIIRT